MDINLLKRREGENEEQYLWRVGQYIEQGKYKNWEEIVNIINEQLRESEMEYRTESSYRKRVAEAKKFYENVFSHMIDDEYSQEIKEQRRNLEKEKVKFRDERNEYSRLLREQARRESFIDLVKDVMRQEVVPFVPTYSPTVINSDSSLIVHLTDIHAGIEIDNFLNKYDENILKRRLNQYLNEIIEIQESHNTKDCIVVLGGDLISGLIHSNLRLENNKNVIEQVKLVSVNIGEFIKELGLIFENVDIHSVSGNHSRVSPNKEQHIRGEELDALVPFYLDIMFSQCKNIKVIQNEIDDAIVSFECRGHLWYGVHGDKDTVSNVVQNLTMMTGRKPDGIIMGHRHTNGLTTVHNTKVVESGCVSGNDNYCLDKRLTGRPEQAVIVTCKDRVVKCLYDIQLN